MENARIIRDSLINYTGMLVSGAATILLVPLYLARVGIETYGIWIAALSLVALFMGFDLGLEWAIPNEIAGGDRENLPAFLKTSLWIYCAIGLVGGVVIALSGISLSDHLHILEKTRGLARIIFLLAGLIFFTNQPFKFSVAAFMGVRRFDVSNLLSIALNIFRAAGVAIFLLVGKSIVAVAIWYVAVNSIFAVVAIALLDRIHSNLECRGPLSIKAVRSKLSFSIYSQLIAFATRILWESPPLIIGIVQGSTSIVPYHIGQRLPFAVSVIHDRAGNVIFPAASAREKGLNELQQILLFSMRWIVSIALPLSFLLWIFAPQILALWIRTVPIESAAIMRITILAVLADAIGAASLHFLWGRGAVKAIFRILAVSAVFSLIVGVVLLFSTGTIGMAYGLLAGLFLCALLLIQKSCHSVEVPISHLLAYAFKPLILPFACCAAIAFMTLYYLEKEYWWIAGAGLAILAYGSAIYFSSPANERRTFLRAVFFRRAPA